MIYEDYKKLKYKYSNNISAYKAILEQRFKDAVILPITAKNGQPMRFVMCEEIKMLLSEIEQAYRDCEIDAVRFVAEESLASCTIEGAKSTLPDTIKLIEGKVPTNKSEKMIQGNIKAIQSILQNGFEFSERSIFELWKAVANDAIDNESIKGDMYRNGDVVVADRIGNITYMSPKCDAIPDMMKELVEFCHDEDRLDPYIKAAAIHYAFVYIHPFCDGNGRTARLLLQNWLINSGLDKYKGVSISSGVLENKAAYYKALENSENNYNDITFIIIFYLETILDTLYKGIKGFGFNERHFNMNSRQQQALTFLRKSSGNILTIDSYSRRYAVDKDTAEKELSELHDNDIIGMRIDGSQRRFCLE